MLPGPGARRITAMLLRAHTTYEFELVARDTSGNTSVSEPVVVTTAEGDAIAPTPVPNLRVAGTTPSSVVLGPSRSRSRRSRTRSADRPDAALRLRHRVRVAVDGSGNTSGPSNELVFDMGFC